MTIAIGTSSLAAGNGAIAMGANAFAAGPGDVAVGQGARVEADDGSAFGTGATVLATHTNSTALGTGATTTRANQVMMGTSDTTYTMAGVASNDSKTAQGAPTHLVTSNSAGDLAAYTFAELGFASPADLTAITKTSTPSISACRNSIALSTRTRRAWRWPWPCRIPISLVTSASAWRRITAISKARAGSACP
jgi:YadA head domain repeat (2 copies)